MTVSRLKVRDSDHSKEPSRARRSKSHRDLSHLVKTSLNRGLRLNLNLNLLGRPILPNNRRVEDLPARHRVGVDSQMHHKHLQMEYSKVLRLPPRATGLRAGLREAIIQPLNPPD